MNLNILCVCWGVVFYLTLTWSQITHAKLFVVFFKFIPSSVFTHLLQKDITLSDGGHGQCLPQALEVCVIGGEQPL